MWESLRAFVRDQRWYIVVAGVSVFVGLVIAAAYATVLDYTSSLNFCAHSCHEMESEVYAEYAHSKHFSNEQGVVVVCADCHVPHHNWPATLATKVMATFNELAPHFINREYLAARFDPLRPELAKRELAIFAATNARTCKACHTYSNMILSEQRPSIRAQHADAMKTDENCLDCHKGVTHDLKKEGLAQAAPANNSFDVK